MSAFAEPSTGHESLHYAQIAVGDRYHSALHTVTQEEIISYAGEWDPQSYHVDPAAAEASVFGGLVASGMHTIALSFRIFNDLWLFRRIGLAGLGIDSLRWLKPVFPGDTLQVRGTISAVHEKPGGRAVIVVLMETLNQHATAVLSLELAVLVRTDADSGPAC